MNNEMNPMTKTILETARLIADFDVALARKWMNEPFNRVNMAYAFASGFNAGKDESEDIHPTADIVIRVAMLDREMRKEAA